MTSSDTGLAIQVEGLEKAFRIPTHRIDSFKERFVHPFTRREYRELRALDGISFDVQRGEFFGIVGRNGSGKSTLLKTIASIYRADAGTIRMAGRLAPFIELGVGFNVELTARENVVLNGVMMGLTPREARERLDAVLDFAELDEFIDLKLKNYSSGMLVRLAFSTMLQADADVLLIDEVLAVGDAAFQQKCADVFHNMKDEGKTIVLVTHEMATVEDYCHRAMLIDGGKITHIGDPAETGAAYMRLNFDQSIDAAADDSQSIVDGIRLHDAWIEDAEGDRVTNIEHGEPIRLRLRIEVEREISNAELGLLLANASGLGLFQFGTGIETSDGSSRLLAGQRVDVKTDLENPLAPGRYFVHCGVQPGGGADRTASLYIPNAISFVVYGGPHSRGLIALDHQLDVSVSGGDGA